MYVCYYLVSTNTTLKVDCGVLYFKVTQDIGNHDKFNFTGDAIA